MATNRDSERTTKDETESNRAGSPGQTMHSAPSMVWFLVPLLLLMAYGYFSR